MPTSRLHAPKNASPPEPRGSESRRGAAAALILAAAALACLIQAGCLARPGHSPAEVRRYTLDYSPPALVGRRLPVILQIEDLASGPNCDSSAMVYQDREQTRQEYTYHRWRARPGRLVAAFLRRDLRHSGLFEAVLSETGGAEPTHRLVGAVEEFYELDAGESWHAVLQATVTLLSAGAQDIAKKVVLQRSYRLIEPAAAMTPGAVAEAMSRAMAELSRQMGRDLHQALADAGLQDRARGRGQARPAQGSAQKPPLSAVSERTP